ncbi:MAG: SMC-Scp complex subunit ScpB [Eubacteriales bacterium]
MTNDELLSVIEGILFAVGEPISIHELSETIKISPSETKELVMELKDNYNDQRRGIQIQQINSKVQMCTRAEHYSYITSLMTERNKTGLSQAALETLSIIAYKQPVTRIEIELLRGVKSSSSLQTLLDRSLIIEAGRLDAPGKPILYETTIEFLKYAGISSIKQLPEFEVFVEGVQETIENS